MDPSVIQDFQNSFSTKYVGVASFTVLVWDHITTFSDEVEYIWMRKKGLAVYLFFLNRYLIPLSFIVNLWAYFSASWTLRPYRCGHFVRYEGSMTMIGISIVFLMMFLRIRVLYAGILPIQVFVLAIFLTFIGINSYVLSHGIPVPHPAYPSVDSCTMIVDQKVGRMLASSTAWLPLLYDTVIFSLSLYRTASSVYAEPVGFVRRVLFQEGLLYYCVICSITLVLTIMINSTGESIRNVASQLHLCLTVAIMSRITLHLKRYANSSNIIYVNAAPQPRAHIHPHQHFTSFSRDITFAPPPAPSSIHTTQPELCHFPSLSAPRSDARASGSSSLENGSYMEMKTFR